jgi:hypothetical protein
MASPTQFQTTVSGPSISGTRALSTSKVVYGNQEVGDIVAVPAATDGQLVSIAFNFATIQLAYVLATTDMTVFTNVDGGAGNDTLVLKANIATMFINGGPVANPFAHDVASIYIDNAGAVAGQLDIYVLSQV